ncbi:MAG: hypothetical protein WD009_14020 [Phycisphaeraceae bacterium]
MTSRGDNLSFAQKHGHLARGGRYFPRWFRMTPFWRQLPAAHRAVLRELFDRLVHADTEHRDSGLHVRGGEWLTSYGALANDAGATYKQARTAIQKARKAGVIQTRPVHYVTATGTRHLLRVTWLDFDAYEWPDKAREPLSGSDGAFPDAEGQGGQGPTGSERAGHNRQINTDGDATSVQPNQGGGHDIGQHSGQHGGQGDGQHSGQQKEPSGKTPERNTQQQAPPPGGSAAASEGAPEMGSPTVREALVEVGVGEPVRTELARRPGLTAAQVREVGRRLGERGKQPGAMVYELRALADRAEALSRATTPPCDPTVARLAQLTSAEREKIEQEVLAQLTDSSVNELQRLRPEQRAVRVRGLVLEWLRANPAAAEPPNGQPPDT